MCDTCGGFCTLAGCVHTAGLSCSIPYCVVQLGRPSEVAISVQGETAMQLALDRGHQAVVSLLTKMLAMHSGLLPVGQGVTTNLQVCLNF